MPRNNLSPPTKKNETPTYHHALKLVAGLAHAELELLHDIGDLLEAVHVLVLHLRRVSDHQKGRPLEENDLVRAADVYVFRRTYFVERSGSGKNSGARVPP